MNSPHWAPVNQWWSIAGPVTIYNHIVMMIPIVSHLAVITLITLYITQDPHYLVLSCHYLTPCLSPFHPYLPLTFGWVQPHHHQVVTRLRTFWHCPTLPARCRRTEWEEVVRWAGAGFLRKTAEVHPWWQAKFKKTNDGETAYSTNQKFNFGLVTAIVTLRQSI